MDRAAKEAAEAAAKQAASDALRKAAEEGQRKADLAKSEAERKALLD